MTLVGQLASLESTGLIRLLHAQPELEYLFRHALMQEAAYSSLIKSDRRTLHQAAGEALEGLYPGQLDTRELAPLLAWHFLEAGQAGRALDYYTLAGDAAARVYANVEAIAHYGQALALALPGGGQALDRERVLHLYTRRGRALELTGRFAEAEQDYQDLEALGARLGDRGLELEGLGRRATLFAVPTASMDSVRGEQLGQQALQLARELGDGPAEARSLWNLSNVAKFANRPAQAIKYSEAAVAIARNLGLREQLALALNDGYSNYWTLGRLEPAAEGVEEALGLWRELGNLPMLADSLINFGQIHMFGGQLRQSREALEEALHISRSIGNPWGQAFSLWTLGYLNMELAEYGQALAMLQESIPLAHEAGFLVAQVMARSGIALISAELGDTERGLDWATQSLARADEVLPSHRSGCLAVLARVLLVRGETAQAGLRLAEAELGAGGLRGDLGLLLRLVQVEFALAQGEYAHIVREADEALGTLGQFGAAVHLPAVWRFKGLGHQGLGELALAREAFERGLRLAREQGLRRAQWHLLTAYYRLERDAANREQAEPLRREALELVERIASGVGSPDLRAKFLNLPEVRVVQDGARD